VATVSAPGPDPVAEMPGIDAVAGEKDEVPLPEAHCVEPGGGVGATTLTFSVVVPEDGPYPALLSNEAVMVSLPTGVVVDVHVAMPATSELVWHITVVPSVNETLPVGGPLPVGDDTVAEYVTLEPAAADEPATGEVTTVLVPLTTVKLTVVVEVVKLASPE
jgi:hypothetical protein